MYGVYRVYAVHRVYSDLRGYRVCEPPGYLKISFRALRRGLNGLLLRICKALE